MAEEAVDTGGPSREFWRLFVEEVVIVWGSQPLYEECTRFPGIYNLYYKCRHVLPVNNFLDWSGCVFMCARK